MPEVFQTAFTGYTVSSNSAFFRFLLMFSFLIVGSLENPTMPSPFNPGRTVTALGLTYHPYRLSLVGNDKVW